MAIPKRVQVKLSSEAAEYVTLTRVVMREMDLGELLEQILGVTGLEAGRVREILKRGSLVSGASRYRWEGFACEVDELEAAMRAVPGPEPGRALAVEKCERVVLSVAGHRVEMAAEAARKRRLWKGRSFWDVLVEEAAGAWYAGYLYRERADRYVAELSEEAGRRVSEGASLLKFEGLIRALRTGRVEKVEFVVKRS
jgi:hypothetical protein